MLFKAIVGRIPVPGLDRSLGELKHYAEIAGIVLVLLTEGHILACASFKLWVHDKLGRYLTKLLDNFLRRLGVRRVEQSRARTGRRSASRRPNTPALGGGTPGMTRDIPGPGEGRPGMGGR